MNGTHFYLDAGGDGKHAQRSRRHLYRRRSTTQSPHASAALGLIEAARSGDDLNF